MKTPSVILNWIPMLSTRLAALASQAGTDLDALSIRERHNEWKQKETAHAGDIDQQQVLMEFSALCIWQDLIKYSGGARARSLLQNGLIEQAALTMHRALVETALPSDIQASSSPQSFAYRILTVFLRVLRMQ